MPFRDLEGFDDDTKRAMTQAFDAACERLGLEPDDPERQEVAAQIIELAARGERDPGKLYALALEAFDG
jgi:beta-phosphoglucomutase-like phosphatase (HAD superfamily)